VIAARRPQALEEIELAGESLAADVAGALYWPRERLLAVADLHLEKGSSFAARGSLLPPYDTADTLIRLRRLIETYVPRCVVALGDSFHDRGGGDRLSDRDRGHLSVLQRDRDWIWIAGNHDPAPIRGIGGTSASALAIGPLSFRHEPQPDGPEGDRRAPSSGGARRREQRFGAKALLRPQWAADGDAGARRLCGRAQRARPRLRGLVRLQGLHGARHRAQPRVRDRRRILPAGLMQRALAPVRYAIPTETVRVAALSTK
jgi:hypothetical protein